MGSKNWFATKNIRGFQCFKKQISSSSKKSSGVNMGNYYNLIKLHAIHTNAILFAWALWISLICYTKNIWTFSQKTIWLISAENESNPGGYFSALALPRVDPFAGDNWREQGRICSDKTLMDRQQARRPLMVYQGGLAGTGFPPAHNSLQQDFLLCPWLSLN